MDTKRSTLLAILVAALGYFVDVYDLILFSVIRMASLKDLGVPEADILHVGIDLLNWQMAGLLIGGFLWGVLGDKRGRISVLFGSIILYSIGNILNGFVTTVTQYEILRFITGVGLAGELGAGITLVSELVSPKNRGYATTFIAFVGIFGAVAAALTADLFYWRTSYFVGGGLGLSLLVLRIAVAESSLFDKIKSQNHSRGDLKLLFSKWSRFKKLLSCIAVGVPIWYSIGILVTFSPEIGAAMGMEIPPAAGRAVLFGYIGLGLGDLFSGLLSQRLKSRRKAIGIFLLISAVITTVLLSKSGMSQVEFYCWITLLGVGGGYWAVFITSAAEQFGTNLRATVTTAVPNLVRASVIPATMLLRYLQEDWGIITSALAVGAISLLVAIIALMTLKESYGQDLDFIES
jgi:predicted MFS family arabinose efflux permease